MCEPGEIEALDGHQLMNVSNLGKRGSLRGSKLEAAMKILLSSFFFNFLVEVELIDTVVLVDVKPSNSLYLYIHTHTHTNTHIHNFGGSDLVILVLLYRNSKSSIYKHQ